MSAKNHPFTVVLIEGNDNASPHEMATEPVVSVVRVFAKGKRSAVTAAVKQVSDEIAAGCSDNEDPAEILSDYRWLPIAIFRGHPDDLADGTTYDWMTA
jgi:hypothetical protein